MIDDLADLQVDSSKPGIGFSSAPFLSRSWLEKYLTYHPTVAWAFPSAPPLTSNLLRGSHSHSPFDWPPSAQLLHHLQKEIPKPTIHCKSAHGRGSSCWTQLSFMHSHSAQVWSNSLALCQLLKKHIPLPLDHVFMSALVCVFLHVLLRPLQLELGSNTWSQN